MTDIKQLVGRTIIKVEGLKVGEDEVRFYCDDGTSWKMLHYQGCCESVAVEDVVGDVDDLLGLVLDAREEIGGEDPDGYVADQFRDSYTWTFYIIQTNKGAVTIRWLGESNGYYSEEVDFEQVKGV